MALLFNYYVSQQDETYKHLTDYPLLLCKIFAIFTSIRNQNLTAMKKILILTSMICIASLANAQSIQTNLDRIQDELDKIMQEANSLPAYKRSAISASILNIKRMLGSNYTVPYDNNYYPQERVMNDREFDNFILSIKQTSSFDARFMQISKATRNTSFYMDQIHDILKQFNFSSERNKIRDILLPKAIDHENIRLLYDLYRFPSEQKRLNELLEKNPRRESMQIEPERISKKTE